MIEVGKNSENCFCTLSKSSELEKIRTFVKKCAEKYGFDDTESYRIALAVDEACSNLIKYAFKLNSTQEIKVQINKDAQNMLSVDIIDEAEPFNPMNVSSPDMLEYFKAFKKGGLGIHIMKLVMDEIEYIPKSNSNPFNILSLKKQLKN